MVRDDRAEDVERRSSRPLLFALNGRRVEIALPDPSLTLLSYLRYEARLTGTKLGCGEGGCGACLVLLATYDPLSKQVHEYSINSCLALLCSLDGCSVTTIEGLGSTRSGLHSVQRRIAGFHGSQCGFCTPGMCIALYSHLHNCDRSPCPPSANGNGHLQSPHPTGYCHGQHADSLPTVSTFSCKDAQNAIVGNICRCTGYRPIVDTCKSFAGDVDVEDLGINSFWDSPMDANSDLLPPFSTSANSAFPEFLKEELDTRWENATVKFRSPDEKADQKLWIQVSSLASIFSTLQSFQGKGTLKIVVGNTSSGYYKDDRTHVYVDVGRVPELLVIQEVNDVLTVGAAVTIERLIEKLEAKGGVGIRKDATSISYGLASHLRKVGNPHVRHRASIGGNLIMAQQYQFDSDVVTLLLAVGATLQIVAAGSKARTLSIDEFLRQGMLQQGWILESISIPLHFVGKYDAVRNLDVDHYTEQSAVVSSIQYHFKSYRASPRSLGNSLSHLNAAFLVGISTSDESSGTVGDVRLAFGAFGGTHARRARRVESFLIGKVLDSSTLIQAVSLLKDELKPFLSLAKKASYKLSLAVDFFSSFFLSLTPPSNICTGFGMQDGSILSSAAHSNGHEVFQNNGSSVGKVGLSGKQNLPDTQEDYLVYKAMEKSEAQIQATGEAVYVDDIPSPNGCLYAAFVLSKKAAAKIKQINTEQALASPGAVAFISANDIPAGGANIGGALFFPPEKLFAEDFAEYIGHPLGLMVADSPKRAKVAAERVEVEYDQECSPILCVEDAVARNSLFSILPFAAKSSTGDVEKGFSEGDYQILDAEVKTGSQYYFYMETQTAFALPDEDNCVVVYSSCQSPEVLQKSVSMCLGLPHHNVRIITRRVGGGFGGKATRAVALSNACALAALKLQRPVRIYLDRKTDMVVMGGRHPTKTLYSVAFKEDGTITGMRARIFIDAGWSEDISPFMPFTVAGGLKKYNWGSLALEFTVCKTNLSSKSAMRGPGHVQGSFIADTVVEHVSAFLGLDTHVVVSKNMHSLDSMKLYYPRSDAGGIEGYTLPSMWRRILERTEEDVRSVSSFNAANVWLKRGLSVLPCVYDVSQSPKPAKVSIFHDGSIVVEVGGIEIGQGLWTKVKQATVHGLGRLFSSKMEAATVKVRVVQADSISLAHGGLTAGSTSSEGSCEAVRQACEALVERLLPLKMKKEEESPNTLTWNDLIKLAEKSAVNLSAHTHWFPDEATKSYLNYGVAATQVELDTLTGAVTILQSDIIYDCGKSMNPAVDIGQIEGSFVQGIGFFLTEELEVDDKGELTTTGTWTYKPPTVDNIPQKFVVELENGVAHKDRILSSKACGEPPFLLASTVHSAVRRAIEAARDCPSSAQIKGDGRYFQLNTPASMATVKNLCGLERLQNHLQTRELGSINPKLDAPSP